MVAVGTNNDGQCGVGSWQDIVAISAGYFHTIGLMSDGKVVVVGKNDKGQREVKGWSDIMLPEKDVWV